MTSNTPNGIMVEIEGLCKWFGDFHVLRDINLTVRSGRKIGICGPSGSGKSTLIVCTSLFGCALAGAAHGRVGAARMNTASRRAPVG